MKSRKGTYLEGNHLTEFAKIRLAPICAIFSITGLLYFLIAIIAMHFLRPDMNPLINSISEYATGKYGWLITSSFIAMGVGTLALALGIFWGAAPTGWSRVGLTLLGLSGVNATIAGFFPTDPVGASSTVSGRIHFLASLVGFFSLVAGILVQTRRFKQDENWRNLYPRLWRLALVILILFLVYFLTYMSDFSGLTERIFTASTLPWLILTGVHLYSVTNQTASFQ